MRETSLLLHVAPGAGASAAAAAQQVPAVTGVHGQGSVVLVRVDTPHEGQLAFVLEQLRHVPGLQALRFLS